MSLNGCYYQYGHYKICADDCVMHGSKFGDHYDDPCSDNVSFMMLHRVDGTSWEEYKQIINTSSPTLNQTDFPHAIALHDPIFPKTSEEITLSLSPSTSVNEAKLVVTFTYLRKISDLEVVVVEPEAIDNPDHDSAEWKRIPNNRFRYSRLSDAAHENVSTIKHKITIPAQPADCTDCIPLVSYKFDVIYDSSTNQDPESLEVTFTTQKFHECLPEVPASIYSQGDPDQVIDILFVPATDSANRYAFTTEHDPTGERRSQFLEEFNQGCREIIRDVVFKEPSLKYWRKQFNFYVNKDFGHAAYYYDGCTDCCHKPPDNYYSISDGMEAIALLHKKAQRDFAQCGDFMEICPHTLDCELFSAEMNPNSESGTGSSFLHELGHALFLLADEYATGWNLQASENFPNNWETLNGARKDAPFRHKHPSDARKLPR